MLISKNWLQDFVKLSDSLTPEELALKLTMGVVEVEGFEEQDLENVVVGKVEKIEHHPNADKLKICHVDIGKNEKTDGNPEADSNLPVRVVCGGSNVEENMLVAMGKIGAKVKWHGEGELVELKKTKIRGEESFGMICAADEIGLGEMFPKESEMEILNLDGKVDVKLGTPLAEALELNDVVFDIDNKSMTHRPDLWGHYGMAREVAAVFGKKLESYKVPDIKAKKDLKLEVKVKDKELCPRYMAVVLDGIKVEPSPMWLQKRLTSVGVRPINNIVDITNYVMFELGQPMHAFDASHLSTVNGQRSTVQIDVRRADKGEGFVALDETEHELTEEMLVISSNGKAVALAGVIGGENSGVEEGTENIVFESANFDATNVRRTATKLGIRTESSARFEKSLDPNNAELALKRAVELTQQLCPEAKVVSNIADEKSFKLDQGPIEVPAEFLQDKIGIEIEKKQVENILESLGFGVKEKRGVYHVTIPTWRATKDVSIPEDIVEEVARMYGYDNIEPTLPTFPIVPPQRNELRLLERKIKELLAWELGFTETYNYSFVSPDWLKKMGIKTKTYIELDNPIAKDRPFLRRSLIPNLLENLESNLHRFESVKLFEIGKTFLQGEKGEKASPDSDEFLPRQDVMLSCVYSAKGEDKPFYEVSTTVMSILKSFGLKAECESQNLDLPFAHPGRSAVVRVADTQVGIITELHPQVQESAGIPYRAAMAEINLNNLLPLLVEKSSYKPLSAYPAMERDIAFTVDRGVENTMIVEALQNLDPLIVQVGLFDVFEGKNVEDGKKSMAYHIVYRSDKKTLESEEVDKAHEKVEKKLVKDFGAEIRK